MGRVWTESIYSTCWPRLQRCEPHRPPKHTRQLRRHCILDDEGKQLLKTAMVELGLSARMHDRILCVARSVADLEGSESIEPIFPRWTPPPGASAATPSAEDTPSEERLQRSPPNSAAGTRPVTASACRTIRCSFAHPRNRPARRTLDTGRRRLDPFVGRDKRHLEAHASRSRPIRSRITANIRRGTATSASWKMTYFACLTTFAPMLTSFSRKVVRFHQRIDRGSPKCRSEFAKLYASPVDQSPNALARAVDT